MKTINVTFEDSEFELLEIAKKDMSWRQFILQWVTPKRRDEDENIRKKTTMDEAYQP